MSYRNAFYNSKEQKITILGWDENGKRNEQYFTYKPHLYVEGPGEYDSIFGTKLVKRIFNTQFDRSSFITNTGITKVFDNFPCVQQFLIERFYKDNETPEFSKNDVRVIFIDIEVIAEEFPDAKYSKYPINVITIYDSTTKRFKCWGEKPFNVIDSDVDFIYCKNEVELLTKFIDWFKSDTPDIVSGWNSMGFDIPYIMNRISNIMDDSTRNSLSPAGKTYFRDIHNDKGQYLQRWFIEGVSLIDYLDIYKRFSPGEKESYKLNSIAKLELGESKVNIGTGNLIDLYNDDWQKFVEYNIQDVRLLKNLEFKLRYLNLVRMFAYIGLTTFEAGMGSISVINGAAAIRAKHKNQILPTFIRNAESGVNPGAFVREPLPGFKKHIVSFDANSLYPNVMITLNTSPETKIGKIIKREDGNVVIKHVTGQTFTLTEDKFALFVQKERLTLSKANIIFTQKKRGIFPEVLDYYYKERKKTQVKLRKVNLRIKELEELNQKECEEYTNLKNESIQLDSKQLAQKIYINATYGAFGNKNNPLGDDDIASSVTLTGQEVIKFAGEVAKKFVKENVPHITEQENNDVVVYGDTDSIYVTLDNIVQNGTLFSNKPGKISKEFYDKVKELGDKLNNEIKIWGERELFSEDSRFVFKREAIADNGVFLQKKRYIIHVLDIEDIPCNKYKYVGVDVVRSTIPSAVKPYIKDIIETMLSTQDYSKTNILINKVWEIFKTLPIESIATVSNLNNYEVREQLCKGFEIAKGTPHHIKAAIFYNRLIERLQLTNKYEKISSGDKIRLLQVQTPNKYNIQKIAYKDYYPEEFKQFFEPDYELIFEKTVLAAIERLYENVRWELQRPGSLVQSNIFDLFS